MSRIFLDDYSIEDYKKEEYLSQQAPGLFSLSPKWFRHSDYELVSNREVLYIKPTKGAKMERYQPFEEFNELLGDFLSMILEINSLEEKEAEIGKITKEYEHKKAEILISFTKNYGPFGLFWEGVRYSFLDEGESKLYLTIDKYLPDPMFECLTAPSGRHDGKPAQIDYDQYASIYFPTMSGPYPCLEFPLLGKPAKMEINENVFYGNYAEPVNHILWSSMFQILRDHITQWTLFLKKGYKIDDDYPGVIGYYGFTEKELKTVKRPTWGKVLTLSFKGFGISCSYEKEKAEWGLTWEFRNLLEALAIMYMLNVTGKMGGEVKICALEGCNKTVLGSHRKYCCEAHGNANRVRRHRAK